MKLPFLHCVATLVLHVTAAEEQADRKDLATAGCNLRCRLKKKLNKMEVTEPIITVYDVIPATTARPKQTATANFTSELDHNNPTSTAVNEMTVTDDDELTQTNQIIQHPTFNRDLFQIQVGSIYKWEELLAPTPVGIAVLGDLILFATTLQDFPLNLTDFASGPQAVKHPQSFRASLVQVVHKGYDAFLAAHVNMDRILLFAAGFPGFIRSITEVLFSGSKEQIQSSLPALMGRIREDTKHTVELASDVVASFKTALNLTSEIHLACVQANSESEIALKNAQSEKSSLQAQLQSIDQMLKENKKSGKHFEELLDSSVKEVMAAVDKLPSGAAVLFQNLAGMLSKVATLNFVGASNTVKQSHKQTPSSSNNRTNDRECLANHRFNLFSLSSIATSLRNKTTNNFKLLSSAREGAYNANKDSVTLRDIIRNASDCERVKQSAEQVLSFANLLGDLARNFSEVKNHPDLRKNLTNVIFTVNKLIQTVQDKSEPNLISETCIDEVDENPWFPGTTTRQMAECRVRSQLQRYLNSSRQNMQDMTENNKKYLEILEKLQNATSEASDFNQAIQLLQRSMELLATLQQHWAKLVRFFQNFESIIDVVFRTKVRDYLSYLKKVDTDENHTRMETILMQMVYQSMVRVNEMSYTIEHLGNLYCSASDKYLMKDIIGLYNLMTLNTDRDGQKTTEARTRFTRDCELTSREISHFVRLERGKLENAIQLKLNEFERVYHPTLEKAALKNEDPEAAAESNANAYEIVADNSFGFDLK